jgi:hypothetical protein
MHLDHPVYQPGTRVRVLQQIPQRDEVWTTQAEGTVVKYDQRKTGSWYAHSKDERLWLDRLTLRTDDGEIVMLSLDENTRLEQIADSTGQANPS